MSVLRVKMMWLALFCIPVLSQTAAAPDLRAAIQREEELAILAAGRTGDISFVPLLKAQLGKKGLGLRTTDELARWALAKLGETEFLQEIHCNIRVDERKGHRMNKREAMKVLRPPFYELEYVGGWFSIQELIYVADSKERYMEALKYEKRREEDSDVGSSDPHKIASRKLGEMLPEASRQLRAEGWKDASAAWKSWVERHPVLKSLEPTGNNIIPAPEGCKTWWQKK
jgi:hypothetical protein